MGTVTIEIWNLMDHLNALEGRKNHLVLSEEITERMAVQKLFDQILERYEHSHKSVSEALRQMIYPHFNVVINGRILNTSKAMNKKLKDGDTLVVLPFLYGG